MQHRICCFSGHGDICIDPSIYQNIKTAVMALIKEHHVFEFWVGRYGNFDIAAARCIREIKKNHPHIRLFLIIPYLTKQTSDYKQLYDGVLMADIPINTPQRFMISKCNQYMVDHSDHLICFVERSWGGAFQTLKYATKRNIKITNIASKA